ILFRESSFRLHEVNLLERFNFRGRQERPGLRAKSREMSTVVKSQPKSPAEKEAPPKAMRVFQESAQVIPALPPLFERVLLLRFDARPFGPRAGCPYSGSRTSVFSIRIWLVWDF